MLTLRQSGILKQNKTKNPTMRKKLRSVSDPLLQIGHHVSTTYQIVHSHIEHHFLLSLIFNFPLYSQGIDLVANGQSKMTKQTAPNPTIFTSSSSSKILIKILKNGMFKSRYLRSKAK